MFSQLTQAPFPFRVAIRDFEEHLEAEKFLTQPAEPDLSDEDILRRALSVRHRPRAAKKVVVVARKARWKLSALPGSIFVG